MTSDPRVEVIARALGEHELTGSYGCLCGWMIATQADPRQQSWWATRVAWQGHRAEMVAAALDAWQESPEVHARRVEAATEAIRDRQRGATPDDPIYEGYSKTSFFIDKANLLAIPALAAADAATRESH